MPIIDDTAYHIMLATLNQYIDKTMDCIHLQFNLSPLNKLIMCYLLIHIFNNKIWS